MAGQVCEKCGQIIKAGEKIIYVEGKPQHCLCPLVKPLEEIFEERKEEIRDALRKLLKIEDRLRSLVKALTDAYYKKDWDKVYSTAEEIGKVVESISPEVRQQIALALR